MKFMNVKERWYMYDTIVISPWTAQLSHQITGWFETFQELGNADSLSFFDSRNKSVGLAYNNQESRDQIPFALEADSISVAFISPSVATQVGTLDQETFRGRLDMVSSFWDSELPQHCSAIFRVNQDERLKTNVGMLPPGYGPVASAMGQGDISNIGGDSISVAGGGWGRAHTKYRWNFPTGIGIPRRATMVVDLRLTEWARRAIGDFWGPGNMHLVNYVAGDPPSSESFYPPVMFMIQVLVTGQRQVQQRGEYHA